MTATATIPERNAAAVAAIYEAYGRGDLQALMGYLAEDVAWDDPADAAGEAGVPYLTTRNGREEVAGFFADLAATVDITAFAVEDVIASGSKVIAEIRASFTSRHTGRRWSDLELHRWTFGPDGLVTAYHHHVDTARHLWGAGLTSPDR